MRMQMDLMGSQRLGDGMRRRERLRRQHGWTVAVPAVLDHPRRPVLLNVGLLLLVGMKERGVVGMMTRVTLVIEVRVRYASHG